MKYKCASWAYQHIDLDKVTREQLEKWKEESIEVDKENKQIYENERKIHDQLIKLSVEYYGSKHRITKSIAKDFPTMYSNVDSMKGYIKRFDELQKEKEKQNLIKQQEKEQQELTVKAILWLKEKGKELHKDYEMDNAIDVANDIAYQEEVERRVKSDSMHSFCGDDNCEDCCGWDGSSNRCSCGNRRVSWVTGYGHSFLNPYIYAEAY